MRKLIIPLLLLPTQLLTNQAVAQQTPGQQVPPPPAKGQTPTTQDQTPPPPPGRNQTPPVMPNIVPIPTPQPITIPAGPPNEASRPITADEAARLALRVQPSLRLAQAQLLAAQGKLQIVKSGMLPTLALSAAYGRSIVVENGTYSLPPAVTTTSASTGSAGVGTTVSTTSATYAGLGNTVQLRQLVFDFNHTRDLVRQADAQQKAAHYGVTLAQLNLIYAVKQAFYTYLQDEDLVQVNQANLKSTQAQLDLANAQLKTGLGEPSSVVTAATAVGTASQALNLAQQTALIAKINLALAIGVDPRTPIVAATSEEPVPPSTDVRALVSLAIKQRPDVIMAEETLRAAGFELSAARTVSSPSFYLSIGATSVGGTTPITDTAASLGLSVTWDIFDGGLSAGTVKEARADIITAKSQLDTASLTVVSDVTQSYVNLKTQEQQIEIAKAFVTDSEEGVRIAVGQFRAGVAIFLQVETAQATLVQAQESLVSAQSALQQARAQLKRAIGQQ